MVLMDAGTKEERELSYYVFKSYIDSDDLSEYHSKLKIKIKETGLSFNYLKQLRDVYADNYASAEELSRYEQKKRYYKIRFAEYISFIESIFELPLDERFDYIMSKNITISRLNYYFKIYKKRGEKYSSQVDSFLEDFSKYIQDVKEKEINKKKLDNFNSACSIFDEIVGLGFYNISDYINLFPKQEQKYLQSKIISYRKLISQSDPDLWKSYNMKMEKNRKDAYESIKDKVDLFNGRLQLTAHDQDRVDIIDYYLLIGIPIKKYIDLCQNYVSSEYITYFKILSSGFVKLENETVDERILLSNNYSFGGKAVTSVDKLFVLEFLKRNNIPLGFYTFAVKKYSEGGFDQYMDAYSKQKILNESFH